MIAHPKMKILSTFAHPYVKNVSTVFAKFIKVSETQNLLLTYLLLVLNGL